MMKRQRRYTVLSPDGRERRVKMTPRLADELANRARRPTMNLKGWK
jgi:hypothetical protein